MKQKRFQVEQIIRILQEAQLGAKTPEICRKYGVAEQTFYNWRNKYGGMEISDTLRLKVLEVQLFHKQPIPPVIPLGPRDACTFDQHGPLRQVGNVVPLRGLREVLLNAEVEDEVLNRREEVLESGFDLASSAERAHLPRDGSMQTKTYSTGPNGSGFGRNTSPSASARTFIRASSSRYAARKPSLILMN